MKQLNVRLPDELHAVLKVLAEADHRSLNAEIVHLLTDVIDGMTVSGVEARSD